MILVTELIIYFTACSIRSCTSPTHEEQTTNLSSLYMHRVTFLLTRITHRNVRTYVDNCSFIAISNAVLCHIMQTS